MPTYNCSSVLPQIGMSTSCACGVNLVPVVPSGEVQLGLQGSPVSWTQSQKLQIRNACCNVTCDAFCASQPAACQAGGSPLMSDGLTGSSSTNKKPPTRPTMRGASGMRSAIGGRISCPCNCNTQLSMAETNTIKWRSNNGDGIKSNVATLAVGVVKDRSEQIAPSQDGMKKATGSRVSTYWGGLKIK